MVKFGLLTTSPSVKSSEISKRRIELQYLRRTRLAAGASAGTMAKIPMNVKHPKVPAVWIRGQGSSVKLTTLGWSVALVLCTVLLPSFPEV